MRNHLLNRVMLTAGAVMALLAAAPTNAPATTVTIGPCTGQDYSGGTTTLPPTDCEYVSPAQVHLILAALPDGTTVNLAPTHKAFICERPPGPAPASVGVPACGNPVSGSPTTEVSTSTLEFRVTSAGPGLAGLDCVLRFTGVPMTTLTGARTLGTSPQVFSNEIKSLKTAGITPVSNCNLFSSINLKAGTTEGLGTPSTGTTTLTQKSDGTWLIDSFFDVFYQVDWVGSASGPLAGRSGTNTGTIHMVASAKVPTLSEWGLIALVLTLIAAATILLRRRVFARRPAVA